MSVHNLLVENNLDLYCRSITFGDGDKTTSDNFILHDVPALYFDGDSVFGGEIPDTESDIVFSSLNDFVNIDIGAGFYFTNDYGNEMLVAYPIDIDKIRLKNNYNQPRVVWYRDPDTATLIKQIGKLKARIINNSQYLVIYPNANNESELFPSNATDIYWERCVGTFLIE